MEKEKAKTFFSRLSQFSVIVIVLITCAKDKVQPKAVGIIAGAVKTEYGQPLDGASIVVTTQEGILYGHSISGTYTVNSVPAGNCKIEVNKEGYLPGVATITVLAGHQTMQDFVLKHGVPYLNLNDSVINTGSQAGGLDEIVGSNASWHAESNDAWLSFDPGTVNGSGSLRISWLVLDSTISRVGSITLKSGPVSKQIKIYQESPVKLFSVKPIIGNYALGQYDSVEIVFSKPVEIVSLSSNWSACQSVMNYRGKNGTAITFSYSCASLGGTYPVSISVKDEKGYTFRFDSDVSFFTKKLTKGAGVTDFLIASNNAGVWAVSADPNSVFYVTLPEFTITKDYSLDFVPRGVRYNPANKLLYLWSFEKLWVFDPESGRTVREIILPSLVVGGNLEATLPVDLDFTSNGTGVLSLLSPTTGTYDCRIVNSAQNDSLSLLPGLDGVYSIRTNYDQSNFLMLKANGVNGVFSLSQSSMELKEIQPPVSDRGVLIVPSRADNDIFIGDLYSQFIMDPNSGSITASSGFFLPEAADFSYRPNEKHIIYYQSSEAQQLSILDYDNSRLMMNTPTIGYLGAQRHFARTTDGNYTIAIGQSLYLFDTTLLTRNVH